MPQLQGPTIRSIQLCTGGLWGEKGKNKIFKKKDLTYLLIIRHFILFPVSVLVRYPKLVVTFLIAGTVLYIDTSFVTFLFPYPEDLG